MAYWNAPNKLKHHEDIAVQSAIKQIENLEILNISLKKEFDKEFKIGIGIHTGTAMIGEVGSYGRSDYTIIGDNVNLASRIEGLTKYFGAKILISQYTKENLVLGEYNIKYVSSVVVKGKTKPIKIYEILTNDDYEEFKIVEDRYNDAIQKFKNKNYKEALDIFKDIDSIYPNKTNKLYIEKLQQDIKIFDFIFDKK
jgi:adenylate cyclase